MALTAKDRREIVSTLYAAALDPSQWQTVADRIASYLDGARVHLYGYDVASNMDLGAIVSGWEDGCIAAYQSHFSAINPYPGAAIDLAEGKVVSTSQLVDERSLAVSEYYNDFLRPQENLVSGTGVLLQVREQSFFTIGTMHPALYRDHLDTEAMATIADLAPDMMQAWELTRVVAEHRLMTSGAGLSLTGVSSVLDAEGRPLMVSAGAERELEGGHLLSVFADGCIGLADTRAQAWLDAARRRLAQGLPLAPEVLSLGEARIRLAPFYPEALANWPGLFVLGLFRPALLLSVEAVAANDGTPESLLARKYGLTPAEATVALGIAQGHSPRQISEKRQVSVHTVRNQLKSAMSKCSVRRQTELAAVVVRLWGKPARA